MFQDSIWETRTYKKDPKSGKLSLFSYMENFPFPFYIVLKDRNALPNVLSEALRQWFEVVEAKCA